MSKKPGALTLLSLSIFAIGCGGGTDSSNVSAPPMSEELKAIVVEGTEEKRSEWLYDNCEEKALRKISGDSFSLVDYQARKAANNIGANYIEVMYEFQRIGVEGPPAEWSVVLYFCENLPAPEEIADQSDQEEQPISETETESEGESEGE